MLKKPEKARAFGPSARVRLCLLPFHNNFRVVEIVWSNVVDMELNPCLP